MGIFVQAWGASLPKAAHDADMSAFGQAVGSVTVARELGRITRCHLAKALGQCLCPRGQAQRRTSFLYSIFYYSLLFFPHFLRPHPMACGGSQARGQIGVIAAGLHHSHSNSGSEQSLHDLHHTSWQCQILNPLSKAGDGTLVLMDTGWICFHRATMGTSYSLLF